MIMTNGESQSCAAVCLETRHRQIHCGLCGGFCCGSLRAGLVRTEQLLRVSFLCLRKAGLSVIPMSLDPFVFGFCPSGSSRLESDHTKVGDTGSDALLLRILTTSKILVRQLNRDHAEISAHVDIPARSFVCRHLCNP